MTWLSFAFLQAAFPCRRPPYLAWRDNVSYLEPRLVGAATRLSPRSRRCASLCGNVSAWLQDESAYLVDGVAINGVSGGPAFVYEEDTPALLVGVVTAYIPNRATGEALPGVSLVRAINPYVTLFKELEGKPTGGTGDAPAT